MNRMFCTQPATRSRSSAEEILADWRDGQPFKIYTRQENVTINDLVRLQMAGFTHLSVVWQPEGQEPEAVDIELAKFAKR